MERVRAHDADSFEALVSRYREMLYRHVTGMTHDPNTADDLLQEAWLRVWTRAEQWDGRGNVKAWLYRITTNLTLNHLRAQRRRREQPLEIPDRTGDEDDTLLPSWMIDAAATAPDRLVEMAERQAQLERMVEALPSEKRVVFRLVHEADMEMHEVAETLGIPEGTVKSRLHHAKKRLAREWREWEE
jgi:RNA polymerase sigma-70 factor (ECF subfamily)